MSFLGKLFGSDKALDKVIDTGSKLLDEAFYTDQEEAADRAKAAEKSRAMIIEWIEASTGSRLARRVLAFAITGVWLFLHLMSTSFLTVGVWVDPEVAKKMLASSQLLDARSTGMQGAVMLILGFYFAAPYMGDLAKGALSKFGKSGAAP